MAQKLIIKDFNAQMDEILKGLLSETEQKAESNPIDEKYLKRNLYDQMVSANLLIDEDLEEAVLRGYVGSLVRKAKKFITAETQAERIEQLLTFVYQECGFESQGEHYFSTSHILMNQVFASRKGMPISLGAIVLYLASSLDLPIFAVNFPVQLILRAEIQEPSGRKTVRFINPWDGKYLEIEDLEKWMEGEIGFGTSVTPDLLKRAEKNELSERVAALFKMALTGERRYGDALRFIEHRLKYSVPEDPFEIRDRGLVLASMDCYQAAIDDLNYFIDQCPDDPTATMLKSEVMGLEKKKNANVMH